MVEIYFDHSATTPLDMRVAKAIEPFLREFFGNPSSLHRAGRQAREAIELARRQVATLLNTQLNEIVFTANGTEADNMALIGVIDGLGPGNHHLITSAIEHPAILSTCRYLERRGVEITYLPVTAEGIVAPP